VREREFACTLVTTAGLGLRVEIQLIGRGVLFGLSALFGSAALLTLVTAYRVGDFAAWRRLAAFAAVHALISVVLAGLAVR
jgi:hypothetical protein